MFAFIQRVWPGLSTQVRRTLSRPQWLGLALAGAALLGWLGLEAWAGARGVGATSAAADLGAPADPLGSGGALVGVILKLGLVIALIYASLYLLRRWQGGTFTARQKQVAVLETTRLSPRQALHLVRAGGQVFLIGATDQSVTVLAEVEPTPEAEAAPQAVPGGTFAPTLARALQTPNPALAEVER